MRNQLSLTLDGEKTFMLGNGKFNASSVSDYVVEGYVDPTYYGQPSRNRHNKSEGLSFIIIIRNSSSI